MSNYINPYYHPGQLDLDMLSFDKGAMCYEYDTICFWAPYGSRGQVYSASDSGCSCPTPFEGYKGENQAEVLRGLERIKDKEHAMQEYKSWGGNSLGDKIELENWLNERGLF